MLLVDSEEHVYTREKVIRKSILNDSLNLRGDIYLKNILSETPTYTFNTNQKKDESESYPFRVFWDNTNARFKS